MSPVPQDRSLDAAGLTLLYAVIIGFSDNCVRIVAADTGLSQFHLMRSLFGCVTVAVVAGFCGLRLRPKRFWAVALRGGFQSFAVLLYFAAFAIMPIAVAAAGLYMAPVFVLLIGWLFFGEAIGMSRLAAVAIGLLGVILVLGPEQFLDLSPQVILPLAAGLSYAIATVATRRCCAEETAACLLVAFFVGLGLWGGFGLIVLTIWPQPDVAGTAGFSLRGFVKLDAPYVAWMAFHGVVVCLATGLVTRAYMIADAAKVGVLEYTALMAAAFWSWLLWGERLQGLAWLGLVLITVAGGLLAVQTQRFSRAQAASRADACDGDAHDASVAIEQP